MSFLDKILSGVAQFVNRQTESSNQTQISSTPATFGSNLADSPATANRQNNAVLKTVAKNIAADVADESAADSRQIFKQEC